MSYILEDINKVTISFIPQKEILWKKYGITIENLKFTFDGLG